MCNLEKQVSKKVKRVINGTGVIVHTNLGRAVLSEYVAQNVYDITTGYNNLEFNLETGKRGSRMDYLEKLLVDLTGCESALVVNNNASSVYLILNTLGYDKEIVVSRGEMVEIGGSFRVSEIVEKSGGYVKEVGTTNKTKLKDYEKGTNEETGIYLKVHRSNFKIIGFTEEVESKQLVELAKETDVVVVEDMGSGVLVDMEKYGLQKERTVQEAIKENVDIVCFSGDKLLGGGQAGIILGKKKYIDKMKENQMLRCLRVDKMSLIALEGTLKQYFSDDKIKKLPIFESALKTIDELKALGNNIKEEINNNDIMIEIKEHLAMFGGGSLPEESIKSIGLYITSKTKTANDIEKKLRNGEVPIISVIKNNEVIINLSTIFKKDKQCIIKSINNI